MENDTKKEKQKQKEKAKKLLRMNIECNINSWKIM
jgi:hypothetical protein